MFETTSESRCNGTVDRPSLTTGQSGICYKKANSAGKTPGPMRYGETGKKLPHLRPWNALCVGLGLDGEAHSLQIRPECLPRLEPLEAFVLARVAVERRVAIHDVDRRQIVTLPNLIVVGVVPRGDLQAPGAKLHVYIVVCDDRDLPVLRRHHNSLPDQVLVPLILRVHANSHVSQDGLRAGRCDREEIVGTASGEEVLEVIELALLLGVLHLKGAQVQWTMWSARCTQVQWTMR